MVVFAGLDWWYHNRAHSDFQLATRLARQRHVLLVNSIGTRMPRPGRTTGVRGRLLRKLRSFARGVQQPVPDLPRFHVYSPVSVPAYGSRLGRDLNTRLVAWQVRTVLWWLRMSEPVALVTPPTAWPVVRRLRTRRVLVNRSDKHSAWSEVDQLYMRTLEEHMLTGADVVLYVAHALMAEDADLVGGRAVFLDHGVDAGWFGDPGPAPPQLEVLPRPRIGFIGTMRDHTVDLTLLERVAREVPGASLILVGPVFMDVGALASLPCVHIVGARPHGEIPSWCASPGRRAHALAGQRLDPGLQPDQDEGVLGARAPDGDNGLPGGPPLRRRPRHCRFRRRVRGTRRRSGRIPPPRRSGSSPRCRRR